MHYNHYPETGLLSPYYVLPLFRRGPNCRYTERFNDWYQAMLVNMDQEDTAKYLALMSGKWGVPRERLVRKSKSYDKTENKAK